MSGVSGKLHIDSEIADLKRQLQYEEDSQIWKGVKHQWQIRKQLRDRFGPKVKLKFITKKKGFLSGILQSAFNPLISKIFDEIDNKAYWNWFGL